MKINYESKRIEMSASESKKVSNIKSEAFAELKALKSVEPNFPVVIIKRSTTKSSHCKLTYDRMQKYMELINDQEALVEFFAMRNLTIEGNKKDALGVAKSFFEVKNWFVEKYNLDKKSEEVA